MSRPLPNKRLRLHGTIAQDLGSQIVTGHLKPGTVLDNEVEASEREGETLRGHGVLPRA